MWLWRTKCYVSEAYFIWWTWIYWEKMSVSGTIKAKLSIPIIHHALFIHFVKHFSSRRCAACISHTRGDTPTTPLKILNIPCCSWNCHQTSHVCILLGLLVHPYIQRGKNFHESLWSGFPFKMCLCNQLGWLIHDKDTITVSFFCWILVFNIVCIEFVQFQTYLVILTTNFNLWMQVLFT